MISEELLLLLEGRIDPETTLEELIGIVDAYVQKHREKPTHEQWENLADAAFLALYYKRPKVFKRIVELIGRLFSILGDITKESTLGDVGRATCLICSDAPTDPKVIGYMLGHLKGTLRAYRELYVERLDPEAREKVKQAIARWLPQPVRA